MGKSSQQDTGKTVSRPVRSIRLIVSISTILLVVVSVVGVGTLAERNASRNLNDELQVRLLLGATNLANVAADVLLGDYPEMTLCPVISDMLSDQPELACVAVLDHQDRIAGHQDARMLGKPLPLLGGLGADEGLHPGGASAQWLGDSDLLLVSVDAVVGDGQKVGRAVVGLHRSYIGSMLARARLQILIFSAVMLVLVIFLSAVLMNRLLQPIGSLKAGMERIGRGDLDTPIALKNRTELGLLADTVDDMAGQIKASQKELVVKERLAHEMDLAYRIQSSLMPDTHLQAGDFFIEGSYKAAMEVGGDYFDIFELPDRRVGMMIADVAGKGLGGCLVTSMIAVLLKSLRDRYDSPSQLLVAMEEGLEGFLRPGVFVTAFYGILDPKSGELVFASAAHSPLTIYRADTSELEIHKTRGIPVGAVKGGMLATTLQDDTLVLKPHDVLLQYTDGLNEAPRRGDDEEFGFERIEDIVRSSATQGRKMLLRSLHESIADWAGENSHHDDLTLLVVSHEGSLDSPADPSRQSIAGTIREMSEEVELQTLMGTAKHLSVAADMKSLTEIRDWLKGTLKANEVADDTSDLLDNALYELCANIIEHGFAEREPGDIDLWYRSVRNCNSTHSDSSLGNSLGCLIVRDKGAAFKPENWQAPDLSDSQVRSRGRGLGLMMIDKILDEVVYVPGTELGNFSLIRIGPVNTSDMEDRNA
jgi:phosphoserine phosphatase RsbU/P